MIGKQRQLWIFLFRLRPLTSNAMPQTYRYTLRIEKKRKENILNILYFIGLTWCVYRSTSLTFLATIDVILGTWRISYWPHSTPMDLRFPATKATTIYIQNLFDILCSVQLEYMGQE